MINKNISIHLLSFLFTFALLSCKKEWLDAKPDKSLAVPKNIGDCQAMLDNPLFGNNDCILDEVGAGDFYVPDSYLGTNTATPHLPNAYLWKSDIFENYVDLIGDWSPAYQRIFYSNIILEEIEKIGPRNHVEQASWNNVKGAALFYRAYNHYAIAKCFCKPYDKNTASQDMGIPLRIESDVNISPTRSTVQETYDQIIKDLQLALSLLPIDNPSNNNIYRVRPTKVAATAMLARVFLAMSDYENSFLYADKTIQSYPTLLDYATSNQINRTNTITNPISRLNSEVIFDMGATNYAIFSTSNLYLDSSLYKLYDKNDWRRYIYFRPVTPDSSIMTRRGSYLNSTVLLFTGLATDEIYLIRAECYARKGSVGPAMQDLNTLLAKRWRTTYNPPVVTDPNDALGRILTERRKELCFRGLRWSDLRRLNKESTFSIILKRVVANNPYTLPPNDPKYVLPIPVGVSLLNNLPQNPR